MPSDSNEVNRALLARLQGDAALIGLVGAVFMNNAGPNLTKFALVTQRTHVDDAMQQATAHEVFTFIVQAVVQGTSGTLAAQAAHRIFELLHLQPLDIV